MDLYEALKTGTSPDELSDAFKKELSEAAARLKAEKEKEAEAKAKAEILANQKELQYAREDLVNAVISYISELEKFKGFSGLFEVTNDSLLKTLKKFESEMDTLIKLNNRVNELFKQAKIEDSNFMNFKYNSEDEDIIRAFINSLK